MGFYPIIDLDLGYSFRLKKANFCYPHPKNKNIFKKKQPAEKRAVFPKQVIS